jgi:hypothetical protein
MRALKHNLSSTYYRIHFCLLKNSQVINAFWLVIHDAVVCYLLLFWLYVQWDSVVGMHSSDEL